MLVLGNDAAQGLDIALAEQGRRHRPRDAHDFGAHHLKIDRPREADRLVEVGFVRSFRLLGTADRR